MRIPARFTIFGQKIKVKYVDDLDGNAGKYSPAQSLIQLQRSSLNHKISKEMLEVTFYHEMFHALFDKLGYDDLYLDEKLVDLLANAFFEINKTKRS